jgi:hypothetical protein
MPPHLRAGAPSRIEHRTALSSGGSDVKAGKTATGSARPSSTTLADLFMLPLAAYPFSAVWTSRWSWSSQERENGVTYGGQSWLGRWACKLRFRPAKPNPYAALPTGNWSPQSRSSKMCPKMQDRLYVKFGRAHVSYLRQDNDQSQGRGSSANVARVGRAPNESAARASVERPNLFVGNRAPRAHCDRRHTTRGPHVRNVPTKKRCHCVAPDGLATLPLPGGTH